MRRRNSVPLDLPLRLKGEDVRGVTVADMLKLVRLVKQRNPAEFIDVRIHALGDRFVVHASSGDNIAARVVAQVGDLRALLTRLRLKYHRLRFTLIANDLALLKTLMAVDANASVVFEAERFAELRADSELKLRDVLVLTNIHGAPLAELQTNLDFWSRGVVGVRFRHVFGQLSLRRIEHLATGRAWDAIIYRGHASIKDGALHWCLADGAWRVPHLTASVYLHLACIDDSDALALAALPAERILMPLRPVIDFDDAELVRIFFERQRMASSCVAAARSVQQKFSQFIWLST